MLRRPHVHTFLPSLSQHESEFEDDKDKNQSARKKIVTASRIYALISISFICCDSHVSFLQSAKQFHWKREWLFFTSWKTNGEVFL